LMVPTTPGMSPARATAGIRRRARSRLAMKSICARLLSAAFVLSAWAGCSSKKEPAAAPTAATQTVPAVAQEPAAASGTKSPTDAINSAQNLLKSGNVDEAAAQLARLQLQGASFNAQQAKDYRQALSEAYDRAIEAAQRGDPKGQAALQLLRAAGPR
jgi:hypothetical protein